MNPPLSFKPLSSMAMRIVLICSIAGLVGCQTMDSITETLSGDDKETASSSAANQKAEAPKGPGPGMDSRGAVIDSTKVESGYGKTVKGINDWEGEITGIPASNSKFKRLKIGMSMRQVKDLIGEPTDSGAYMTGKAWIPFYFGSDRHRYEMVYKGQGRLIFAGGSLGDYTGGNLIWIIHNSRESGYR